MPSTSLSNRKTVILVDDDPDVLRSLRFAFEVDGFDVSAFPSGEALLAQALIPSDGCLVLDQVLDGVDGLTLLERLRQQGHRPPALLITTPTEAVLARAARAGVAVIEKPLECEALISEVRRLIEDSRA